MLLAFHLASTHSCLDNELYVSIVDISIDELHTFVCLCFQICMYIYNCVNFRFVFVLENCIFSNNI